MKQLVIQHLHFRLKVAKFCLYSFITVTYFHQVMGAKFVCVYRCHFTVVCGPDQVVRVCLSWPYLLAIRDSTVHTYSRERNKSLYDESGGWVKFPGFFYKHIQTNLKQNPE